MKRLLSIVFLSVLMLTFVGCDLYKTMETAEEEEKKVVQEESQPQVEETKTETKNKILDATGYVYDEDSGELKSPKGDVLYTYELNTQNTIYPQGIDGDKLVVWTTGLDNSPGPGWVYEIWYRTELHYIDLTDVEAGLQKYVVPQWRQEQAKKEQAEWESTFK